MKTISLFRPLSALVVSALGFTGALEAAPAETSASRIEVAFFEPERFTDVRDTGMESERGRDYILGQLKTYLQERAGTYLPEGAILSVRITDVDLAGEFEPWRGPAAADVRIVKEIYPPRIKLSFRLSNAAGEVIKQGERELTNLNFLMTAAPTLTSDPYRHDKALLDDWLRTEFQREKKR